jgi:hypothetical protein
MSSDKLDKSSANELEKAASPSIGEPEQVAPDYTRVTTWKLLLGVLIGAAFFGAAVYSLIERRMLPQPPPPQQAVERSYDPSSPKMTEEMSELEIAIRLSARESVANNASSADAADEIIRILQRRVFLNEVNRDRVRERVNEFMSNKRGGAAQEELLTALKAIVREILFGTTNPGTSPQLSPTPGASPVPRQETTPHQ